MGTNESTNQGVSTNIVDEHQHDQLISSFLEIAVGQTVETARNFLHRTNWNIERAINLFLMNNNNPHDSSMHYNNRVAASHSDETWNNSTTSDDSESTLASLYRPPLDLLFEGSFVDAKSVSNKTNQWLIVNLQSKKEFASHTLNLDVWSNDKVSTAVKSNFILWQVYDHTVEGQKISSFYKINYVPPVVLVIDPITGQKMRMWSGLIEAEIFVEGLNEFMNGGPREYIASLSRNKDPQTKETFSSRNNNNNTDQLVAPSWGEDFKEVETRSTSNYLDQIVSPTWRGKGPFAKEETCSSSYDTEYIQTPFWNEKETCLEFPVLTEEPKGDCDRSVVCILCVRFPDGTRKQRRFLKTEPIQLLWSFCYSHMEASEKKVFKLVHAIPGATKTLDYEANETFDQSGLANSMISVTWG